MYVCSVKLSSEARERLEAIRDFLEESLDHRLTLDEVCSTIISQVQLRGMVE